jgi:hypothetical protein
MYSPQSRATPVCAIIVSNSTASAILRFRTSHTAEVHSVFNAFASPMTDGNRLSAHLNSQFFDFPPDPRVGAGREPPCLRGSVPLVGA